MQNFPETFFDGSIFQSRVVSRWSTLKYICRAMTLGVYPEELPRLCDQLRKIATTIAGSNTEN
jgi:hypothetical protein